MSNIKFIPAGQIMVIMAVSQDPGKKVIPGTRYGQKGVYVVDSYTTVVK